MTGLASRLALLFLLLFSGVSARAADWVDFHSAEQGFAVLVPQRPAHRTQQLPSATMEVYEVRAGDLFFVVTVTALGEGWQAGTTAEALLDRVQENTAKAEGAVLKHVRTFWFGSARARDLVIERAGTMSIMTRTFITKRRMYQVIFRGPLGAQQGPDAERYFGSFHFVEG